MNIPQISVIVPVYNVEKYLSRCIESILSQTFTDLNCCSLMTAAQTARARFAMSMQRKTPG